MFKKCTKLLTILLLLVATAEAANIKVITKYGKTGGIAGRLNTTADKINGREICQNNPTAGCDFSNDSGWSDNGTPNDGSDDTYSGDLLVRTNDIFELVAAWSWNGTAGAGEDTVTLKSTLPQGYVLDELPGSCDATTSTLSADKRTISCVRKGVDKNGVGTVSEDLTFPIRVLGSNANGTQPGDISFEISAQNATTQSDNAGVSLTVTAAPRWNLQKSRYWHKSGYKDTDSNKTGFLIYYKYYVEVDEVNGEVDDAPAYLGSESMGADATFEFTDDLSGVSPNAKLVECKADTWSNSGDPFPFFYASYPDRSIATPQGTQQITCSQSSDKISVRLEHVDARLDHIPRKTKTGANLPVNRAIAAIGVIEVFVPLDDVKAGEDGVVGNSDDGSIRTINRLTSFDPTAPSGISNFGNLSESEKDNSYALTLYYAQGSFDKGYATKHGLWEYREGGSAGYRTGDGLLGANAEFASRLHYGNYGGIDLNNVTICDVIDANRMEIVTIGDNEPVRYQKSGPYEIYGLDKSRLEFEYASTYVNDSWLASKGGSLNVSHGDDVAQECAATGVWYSSIDEAKAHGLGVVTKVRVKIKDALKSGEHLYIWLKHKVRKTTLDGTPLQNGDEIVNYGSAKDDEFYTSWIKPSYIPHAYPNPVEKWTGDRVTFSGAKVRIIKTVNKNSFEPGQTATFTLDSSYTNDTGAVESSTVTIKDILPEGLKYITSSTEHAPEPTVGTCSDVSELSVPCDDNKNQVLIWSLGTKNANVEIPKITYKAQIDITAPQGTSTNYALISAPSDASAATQRESDVNINITIPATINLSKSVANIEPLQAGEGPIKYEVNARNGSAVSVTELDMIDILPFNGDNTLQFRDISVPRNPASNFHGTRGFEKMELIAHPHSPALCDLSPGVKYYYTQENPININLSPKDTSNQNPATAGSIWCEGDSNGPNASCGFTKAQVTAIRASGPTMEEDAVCQLKIDMNVNANQADDIYGNSAGASATGVTLPVLSNAAPVVIVKSAIGNYVWFDENNNGVQDDSEAGLNDINVSLYKSDNTLVERVKTTNDANGNAGYYLFTPLDAGDYYIKVDIPSGFNVSPKDATADDKDSDIDANGKTTTIHLGRASEDLTYDAGLYKPSSIGDVIWYDSNKNGIQDSGEDCRGLNLEVSLLDASNQVISTQTTTNCHYLFNNLNQGSYKVKVTLPNGYMLSPKAAGTDTMLDSDMDVSTFTSDVIVLSNGIDRTDIDVGYFTNTSIGDTVWLDTNANGVQDSGESGIDGVEVKLLDANSNVVATQTTSNGGKYLFKDLAAGTYKVKFTVDSSYKVTSKNMGSDDAKDSDVDSVTKTTSAITLTQGNEDLTWDLGLYQEASIADRIWVDDNGNGIQDAGEDCDSLELVVTLLDSNISQRTQNCTYKFDHLKPGSYHLKFDLPSSYTSTHKDSGDDDTKDSDIDENGLTPEYILISGENKRDVDAGMLKDASLGDIVWLDSNADGKQDSSEAGLQGVTVVLLNADGSNTGKSTVTDANGHYTFSGLKPAGYKIQITLPAGYELSNKDVGGDEAKDSDIDTTSKISDTVVLHSGENYLHLDAGVHSISSLGDFVWVDKNANGIQDDGEVGLAGVNVELLNGDNSPIGKSTTTDATGYYHFSNLVSGYYKVKFSMPDGYTLTDKDSGDDSKDSDVDTTLVSSIISLAVNSHDDTIDMGVYKKASVGDRVWEDINNNGIQDTGEPAVSGVLVTLLKADATSTGNSMTTGEDGLYHFDELTPDTYQVKVRFPEGYTAAKKNVNNNHDNDSDIDMQGLAEVTLRSGDNVDNLDIGIVKDGSIGDRVWLDANKNGIQDTGEKGVPNVTVVLLHADGSEANQTVKTNAEGIYAFTGLKPDSYKVKIIPPVGYFISTKDSGEDSKDSDIDPTTVTTDTIVLQSGGSMSFVDAGLYTTSELGDFVWLDTNANGIQEADEKGLANVEVTLLDANGDVYGESVTTDNNGAYHFNSLPAGEYHIKVTLPEGYQLSAMKSGADQAKDSDINPTTLTSDSVTLGVDTKDETVDIGLYQPATIGDTIWLDANNNGLQDAGETCQDQILDVSLLDTQGAVVKTTKTAYCKYQFTDVKPAQYSVKFTLPKGLSAAKKDSGDESKDSDINKEGVTDSFTVISGEVKDDIDAGFMQNASIGDTVWLDANTNGIQDAGEIGVPDILVTLLKEDGTPAGHTVKTDKDGHYHFSDLEPNKYAVMIVLPEGYVLSPKDQGSDDSKDSDADVTAMKTEVTTLESGENDVSWDMGIYALIKLGDRVWLDRNADGIQDENEEGLANINVSLLDANGAPTGKSMKTDAKGNYLFTDLKPGSYKVAVEIPNGYVLSPENKTDDTKDSDIYHDSNTTDMIVMQSGIDNTTVDAGLIALKDISGLVMVDINDDDKADKALKDVTIALHRCDGAKITQTKTSENGSYTFRGMIPGCYIVTEVDPQGYTSVSDVDGVNDNNITVHLQDKDVTGRDFLDEPLLKISGHTRGDMDFDGDIEVDSSKDINLEGVTMTLFKGETKIGETKTNQDGFYEFANVTPGHYRVAEEDPKGFDSLRDVDGKNDNNISVVLSESDITDRDFDDQKTILVSGKIEVDIDGDKIVDKPLKDTQLLLCVAGEVCTVDSNIATTYTDSNGSYIFEGLKPGNYSIVEVDKPGYESLRDKDGNNDNIINLHLDGLGDVVDQDFEDLAVAPHFIVIQKTVAKKEASIGTFVPYSISVENVDESFRYAAVKIKDTLPGGFKYVKGSATIVQNHHKQKINATGISKILFGSFALNPKEKVTISYLLKVGVGVAQGKHINHAVAVQNEEEVNNISTASVKVVSDPFVDNAVVIGKVFSDKNANGKQDEGEEGIPGIRLATVTGMIIETDGYGRYHIADVKSGGFGGRGKNFIVKVDATTLPKGAKFTTENPRVYRITSGQLNVIDFGVKLPKQKGMETTKKVTKVTIKKEMVPVTKSIKVGSIYFDSDQDCIRPDQVGSLRKIAQKIQEAGHGSIMIEGNTDARAPMWYNKKLAYKRAQSVFKELRHILGDQLAKSVDVVYDNCEREVTFNPLYDWWGKPNAPRTKKECTKFGILKKDCNRLLDNAKGGAL